MRRFSGRTFILALALGVGGSALAQTYPTKPVRIIVALSPGSATDVVVRAIASRMSDSWKQPVVVENRPGGAGAVAGSALVASDPDGHTLMAYSDGHAVNAALNAASLPYDTLRDIARVALLANFSTVLVTAPSLGITSLNDLVALAKRSSNKLTFGSAGIGGGLHLSGEMFKMAAGIDSTHIPYKGTPDALADVLTGRVQYMFAPIGSAAPHIRSGKLVALGVGSAYRSALLPEVPTVAEAGVQGFEYDLWAGLFAPGKTAAPILAAINAEVGRVMSLPEVREPLLKQGFVYRQNTPEEFDRRVRAEIEKLQQVAKVAGIALK